MKAKSYRFATPPTPMKPHGLSLLAVFGLISGLLGADEQIRPASNPAVSQLPAATRPNPAIVGDVRRSVIRVTNPIFAKRGYTHG